MTGAARGAATGSLLWAWGLVRRRTGALLGAASSIALAVAVVVALGSFASTSRAGLTVRAAGRVPVDWQVQVTAQGDARAVAAAAAALPAVSHSARVRFATVAGLETSGTRGTRTTGRAVVVALPASYATAFPGELRTLVGSPGGAALLQQTAANLAAAPGDTVSVRLRGGRTSPVRVTHIVDMPAADSFFQVVGTAAGAGAAAPPDDVLLVSPQQFTYLTAGAATVEQVHVRFDRTSLPADPGAAAARESARANHFQLSQTGSALIGDNLGSSLVAAQEDARYADLLFLLLGLPGFALAVVVAALVVALRGERRRREVGLLRLRGASTVAIMRLVAVEGLVTGGAGALLGLGLSVVLVRYALGAGARLSTRWALLGVLLGLTLAVVTQLLPLIRRPAGDGRGEGAGALGHAARPWPLRLWLDALFLTVAAVAFSLSARSGYQVVLAPEGIPSTQVNYAALLGPAFAWPGLALLVWRVVAASVARRSGRFARSGPGRVPELEAAVVRRRRWVIARGAAGLAVAIGLAASTAVFTSTYQAQSRLDVALTVGSDVAVTEPASSPVDVSMSGVLSRAPAVTGVEPLQHRFAYVGPDLQDIYGVRPETIARVAPLQDAFVPGSTVRAAMAALARTPDGVLLSGETLHDYQLHVGDAIRLRLQTGHDRAYRPVQFHVVGQVNEFPTAPKDSFIVANARYLANRTGSASVQTFLIASSDPRRTAKALRASLLSSGASVQDTVSARSAVTSASGLAATDLRGLSRLELTFGLVLALACSGLALGLGIVERRRALVLLSALGADRRQRSRFLLAEAWAMVCGGLAGGLAIAGVIAYLLIKVLTGIFDPPPSRALVPWTYLGLLALVVGGATALVVAVFGRLAGRAGPAQLRDL